MTDPDLAVAAIGITGVTTTVLFAVTFAVNDGVTNVYELWALVWLAAVWVAAIGVTVWLARRDLRRRESR